MGLLDELLKDANRILDRESIFDTPGLSERQNLDHVVDTASRVLTTRFNDVLKGRSIRLRPEYDARTRVWHLRAELQLTVPFSMAVAQEVLAAPPGDPALINLAVNEATKLGQHLATEISRMVNARPVPAPQPPSPVRDFDVTMPDLQRPLLTFREWMTASSNQRLYVSGEQLRQWYDRYTIDWYSQNDGAAKDEVLDAITKANALDALDEAPIPDMPFGKEAD